MDEMIVPAFDRTDFIKSTKPYEWLMQYKDNAFLFEQAREMLSAHAKSVKVNSFNRLLKSYMDTSKTAVNVILNNSTAFTDQPIELLLPAEWEANDGGISTTVPGKGHVYACNHPIMPIQRLVNIDSECEKIKLAYKRTGNVWRTIIVDRKTISSRQSIVQLSEYGIAVNSENAAYLVRYLTDAESYNIDKLESINSVGRLGWIENHGFSPYVDNLVFDGDMSFKFFFEAVKSYGSYEAWKEVARKTRKESVITRILLAASFASVLVKPCNALPFFVHIWGGTEAGKTVGLMLAASVWANPSMGAYIHTFNSTSVGQELSAGFVNSLPLILDELQIIGDKKDFDKLIYTLSEGVGRSRGSKNGGLQRVASWQNCILTTGEMPITTSSSAGGAVNRIIEIDCKEQKLFKRPVETVDIIKKNYGFAGHEFIELLQIEENMQLVTKKQKEYFSELLAGQNTDKQAMAASLILTADYFISKWIFNEDSFLTSTDIEPYLLTKQSVSVNDRAYEYLVDYININQSKFVAVNVPEYTGEIWGMFSGDECYIIKTMFDKIMQAEGYSSMAFLSWAKENGYIRVTNYSNQKGNKRNTVLKRFNPNTVNNCVCLKMPNYKESIDDNSDGDLPF